MHGAQLTLTEDGLSDLRSQTAIPPKDTFLVVHPFEKWDRAGHLGLWRWGRDCVLGQVDDGGSESGRLGRDGGV